MAEFEFNVNDEVPETLSTLDAAIEETKACWLECCWWAGCGTVSHGLSAGLPVLNHLLVPFWSSTLILNCTISLTFSYSYKFKPYF